MSDKIILIIDDDDKIQRVYKDRFESEKYKVKQALSVEEGIVMAQKLIPDLILLDIMFPSSGKGGLLGLDELKADQATRSIPVVMLTNIEGQEKLALEKRAVDYIIKAKTPIEEVVAKVKKYIGH